MLRPQISVPSSVPIAYKKKHYRDLRMVELCYVREYPFHPPKVHHAKDEENHGDDGAWPDPFPWDRSIQESRPKTFYHSYHWVQHIKLLVLLRYRGGTIDHRCCIKQELNHETQRVLDISILYCHCRQHHAHSQTTHQELDDQYGQYQQPPTWSNLIIDHHPYHH